jgi:class I fructose-bisphosphate aldolase
MASRIDRILREQRALMLSFDQGLEDGPKSFNLHTIDPEYVLNIALEGQYTAIAVHPGIAEKYMDERFRALPLVIKLNGKTQMQHINPLARQTCSVERAIKLGAEAVGYSIYDGSPSEAQMFQEFGTILEQAHDYGIPVIAWMYPRGEHLHTPDTDAASYAARIALELGADAVKLAYNGDKTGFEWVVKSAGKTKVLAADTEHTSDLELLQHVRGAVQAGASGAALGKTVWQHPKPFSLTRALHAVIFKDKTPEEALKYLS